ncbi:beta-ketoacyl-ACP synthase III [Nesterenkonia alkaliphila]|uniref:Beta-ketoacyl-[acyl-carrier-protein] synthase III n=1 Tax=Nesterenkonia alkaliphila TaxID=1463631 RepID=A0A7K1UM17_9MICC|nr:beta-ketoacyl-ACP synthase III [Nesterenkonia alkaliphila]MVT27484.1 beta-ketoacyl-ACP synthase III [Nesterenkonia alkaliphila]GFZ89337.1 beta-ketoacyl-[acyl-carrier-protein] synthase III [Nesterenkonia alkaliphila]
MTATLTPTTTVHATAVLGLGVYRPSIVVDNEQICQWIDSSDEWIRQRTGIVTRHRAPADVSVVDMAEAAALEALRDAGTDPSEIGAVLVSTVTHPYQTPSAAADLAARLGSTPAAAYDISAACAGYCYGIGQADALVRAGHAEKVLVVGVEKLSDVIDNHERTISFLLGDGAGAVVVGPSEEPGISASILGSNGEKWGAITMDSSLLDLRDALSAARGTGDATALLDPEQKPWPTLRQDGQTVFRWAVWEMAKVAKQALDKAGISAGDLAAFVPHQANIRIIDELAKQLKLPEHVLIGRDITDAGNTSAASIPLALHRLRAENPGISGGLALQIGFGAGLVYGAQVIRIP